MWVSVERCLFIIFMHVCGVVMRGFTSLDLNFSLEEHIWLTKFGLCRHQPCGYIPAPKDVHEQLHIHALNMDMRGLFSLLY